MDIGSDRSTYQKKRAKTTLFAVIALYIILQACAVYADTFCYFADAPPMCPTCFATDDFEDATVNTSTICITSNTPPLLSLSGNVNSIPQLPFDLYVPRGPPYSHL